MKVIELKESVTSSNDAEAEKLRGQLKKKKTVMINLMSSPGSGKTTTLKALTGIIKPQRGKDPKGPGGAGGDGTAGPPGALYRDHQ